MIHSSMLASIVRSRPFCSKIFGWIEAQQIHICLICLALHSICLCIQHNELQVKCNYYNIKNINKNITYMVQMFNIDSPIVSLAP